MDTTIFSPASLALVLMLRLVKDAARSSTITWSTVGAENLEVAEARNSAGAARAFIIIKAKSEGAAEQSQHRVLLIKHAATRLTEQMQLRTLFGVES